MTKLCARGKAAAKRKFKVYPSAYANAYASKICAGKIKDPSGVKKKDWGPKKAFLGGLFKKKDEKKKEIQKEENIFKKRKQDQRTKQQRLEELKKEMGMSKGGGADMRTIKTEKKTRKVYGDRNKRRQQLKEIQNPISEYGPKGKLKIHRCKSWNECNCRWSISYGQIRKIWNAWWWNCNQRNKFLKGVF